MIGYCVALWFCAAIVLLLSVSLLRGNCSAVHGKVFDGTEDKEGYARTIGRPALLMGVGLAAAGVLAAVMEGIWGVVVSLALLALVLAAGGVWFARVQKRF